MQKHPQISVPDGEETTPWDFMLLCAYLFGPFDLDAAATKENRVVPRWIGPGGPDPDCLGADAFSVDWGPPGSRVWINPPYGCKPTTGQWVKRIEEQASGGRHIVALIPSKPDTCWFQEHIIPSSREVRFLKGRLNHSDRPGPGWFASVVAVLDPRIPRPSFGDFRWDATVYWWDWREQMKMLGIPRRVARLPHQMAAVAALQKIEAAAKVLAAFNGILLGERTPGGEVGS